MNITSGKKILTVQDQQELASQRCRYDGGLRTRHAFSPELDSKRDGHPPPQKHGHFREPTKFFHCFEHHQVQLNCWRLLYNIWIGVLHGRDKTSHVLESC
ncbi:hypothetical protein RvY_10080 [Ramazzottius varieornatus]|uniref:Uncharacterized protein n=1 Tax=Ramazzottius varieornatus TaxID=947166 RepID=A0A1D1VBK1_RAMVA|nr:hypothetical protein RvY_10080 [Ramazzottius varieornatus]